MKFIHVLIFALLVYPMAAFSSEVAIEGRIFTQAGPLPDAKVSAYQSYADLRTGALPAATTTSDHEGVYRLRLPLGSYYFTSRGSRDGREYYAYHGSNPVKVDKQKLWLTLMATEVEPVPRYVEGPSSIEGLITYKGQPAAGAFVALYSPESKTFKGLGIKTESADPDGRFRISVEPGKYVVTARKIADGNSNRPPRKGDLFCYYSRNPLEVKADRIARIELSCYPKIDRPAFVSAPTIRTDEFKSIAERSAGSGTGIRGKVVDTGGKPVPGLTVLAYPLASPVFMMYNLYHGSEFSSETDAEGRFFIPLDDEGDYGIVARNILGDGPHLGEIYGLYQGNTRHAVTYKKGTLIDNINITAGRVMASAVAPETGGQKKTAPTVVGTPGSAAVSLTDSVIANDTIWQGEIQISGVISVKRGATLTIRPGTIIKFKRIDRDHNDIGDGEILVEGRLVAQGTRERKIVFTSAEEKPGVNDWSYLQFLASDPGNVIENCRFEYAFAGVMVHYAELRISDSLFRNNNRGLHYNTADLHVEHSTFADNRVGIRFMRFEGNVRITDNDITRNDIGVLFVRQHVNAIDFERLNRGTDTPRFQGNNIASNRNYNFSLGEGQDRDISVAGNWWGTTTRETIAETIYDQSKDASLSRIIYEPFLAGPVPGAGVRDPKTASIGNKKAKEKLQ